MQIGAQFYTVRDFCKDLESFSETLKKVADIGYKNVQISGTCPYEAEWLKAELDKNGLKCVLTHIPNDDLIGATEKVIENHNVFDCKYVGLGYFDIISNPDENYKKFIDTYSGVAKKLYEGGKYFMYHNHDHEFVKIDGKTILERMVEEIPAEHMGVTLDTYWVQMGGGDIGAWLEKLKGRVPCIHLKDFKHGPKMAYLGEGNINFERVFQKAEEAGTQYMLVEQDNCYDADPFDCLKKSYEYLKARGFE